MKPLLCPRVVLGRADAQCQHHRRPPPAIGIMGADNATAGGDEVLPFSTSGTAADHPGRRARPRSTDANGHAFKKQRRQWADAGPGAISSRDSARRAKLLEEAQRLPIYAARQRLVQLVHEHQVVVLVGETGSGKTTQIPQFLLAAGLARGGAIACTQPRRVAAVTVARRVAEEMGTPLGQKVGYTIRFDDTTSPATRIKYMTDGMLLREALVDATLSKYKVIIVDEVHERTISTDVLLGLLKRVLAARPGGDLRLLVMSATLEAAKFVTYLPGAVAARVHGRSYPVATFYTAQPEDNYLDAALNAVLQLHAEEGPGDILVFLTGQDEIESLERLLQERSDGLKLPGRRPPDAPTQLLVLPIFAALAPEQQMKVFEPAAPGCRKAVLATNIAETSVTIPGVRYVVDPGFVKARAFSARLGVDSLQVVPVSQAQARQRSGRAGREAPGKAYRLYPESAFDALALATPPELLRSNLSGVVLQLLALGVQDLTTFDFLDPPPQAAIIRSLELLYALGALDGGGKLTPAVGVPLARLPVDPMFGRVLLAAADMGCTLEAMQVVALVSSEGVWVTPRAKREASAAAHAKFASRDGDHATLLAVWRAFMALPRKQQAAWCHDNFLNIRSLRKAGDILEQLQRQLSQLGLPIGATCGEDLSPLHRALTAGLFPHAARRLPDGTLKVVATGQQVFIHPSSVLSGRKPDCVIFNELVRTTKHYARVVAAIEPRWLPELCPQFFAAKATGA